MHVAFPPLLNVPNGHGVFVLQFVEQEFPAGQQDKMVAASDEQMQQLIKTKGTQPML